MTVKSPPNHNKAWWGRGWLGPDYRPMVRSLGTCSSSVYTLVCTVSSWLIAFSFPGTDPSSELRAKSCGSKLLSTAPHPPGSRSLGCGDNIHLFSFPQPRNLSPSCLPCPGEASPELWSVKLYGAAKTCKVRAGRSGRKDSTDSPENLQHLGN